MNAKQKIAKAHNEVHPDWPIYEYNIHADDDGWYIVAYDECYFIGETVEDAIEYFNQAPPAAKAGKG